MSVHVENRDDTGAAGVDPALLHRRRRGEGRLGYRALVFQLALKDFKIRYTSSTLGYAWSVINPLVFFLLYYVVFSVFLRFEIPNYPGFLLVGVVIWNFFSEGSSRGVGALIARSNLLTKMAFPRSAVIHAALLSAALTFVISLLVLLVVLWTTGTRIGPPAICFPLLLLDLLSLTLGVSLLLAPLYVRFHDVGYLWTIGLQVGFWITPIFYSEAMVPADWLWIMWCNPIARIIGDSRRAVLYGLWPGTQGLLLTTLYCLGILVLGVIVFRRLQARVVEYL